MFWTWLAALAFGQLLVNRTTPVLLRVGLGILIAATFYVSMVQNTAWTSGWLPAFIALAVVLLLSNPKAGLLILIAGIFLLGINYQKILSSFLMVGDNQFGSVTRLAAWQIVFEIIKANPVFGLGPANYYWYTRLFPIMGYSVVFNSHNNYVDLVAQTGFLGLGCFLWLGWELGKFGLKLRKVVPDGFAKAYVIGSLGGLVGTLIAGMFGDWVIPFVYNIGFAGFRASVFAWLFLGGLIAVGVIYNENAC
jgi:hypothetical protein